MELGLIKKVDIDNEMQQAYLDYAMSVIVARALPDARDGLKPVQRRVLYAMYDMGLRQEASYKKSARIVGEVLGKYHPHGDVAVYESMARLAQDFTMRYALVDGQGNFGSVDGDPPAAMRYTEARMSAFAMEMLGQIDRDTVRFSPNFDGTLTEPDVLPAAAPNLLVNGASGIAVGMATNIPPHNLGEVVDALVLMLHEWERMDDLNITDLMRHIKGPDFPTGGIILEENGQEQLLQAYASGRGRLIVRGRVQKEDMERGKSRLIITELPYQVNKSALIERIAELVRDNDLEGISDLRDESDRQGMRIVIELKAGTEAEPVLRKLYQRTPMETTFGINLLALVDGEPRLLSLKQALRVYLEHRLEVVRRRSEFDLAKAKARAHILEGLRIALGNLDEIIALIKAAPDAEQARVRLMERFKLSELQANAILEMQLRRLAALERKKIEQEYQELLITIRDLEALLKSPKKMRQTVEEELAAVKEKYNDKRRTQIVALKAGESAKELLTTSDLTPARPVWIGIMEDGTIGRAHDEVLPRLSGRAAPRWLLRATTHHTLYLASEDGRAAAVAVESVPEVEKFGDGVPLNKVSPLDANEPLAAVLALPPRSEWQGENYIATVSRLGMVKKSTIDEMPGPSTQRFVLAKVNPGDALGYVFLTNGSNDFLLVTAQGMAIRFSEAEVRAMGLVAAGVNGIKLAAADRVVGADRFGEGVETLAVNSQGKAWRVPASEFPTQGRYGQGVQLCKLEGGARLMGLLTGKKTQNGILHFKNAAAKAIRLDDIAAGKRQRTSQELAAVKTGDAALVLTSVLDSLAFFVKPEAASARREAKKAPAPEPPAIEIGDEKRVQAVLPGMEPAAAAPSAEKPSEPKPGRVSKAGAKVEPPPAAPAKAAARKGKAAAEPLPLQTAPAPTPAPSPKKAKTSPSPAAEPAPEAPKPARKAQKAEPKAGVPASKTEAASPKQTTETPKPAAPAAKSGQRKPTAQSEAPLPEAHGWEQVEPEKKPAKTRREKK